MATKTRSGVKLDTKERVYAALTKHQRSFPGLPDSEIRFLTEVGEIRAFRPGESFLAAGAPPDKVGFVIYGLLKMHGKSQQGTPYVREFIEPGSVVADYVSALNKRPASVTVEAIEPSCLLILDFADVPALFRRDPAWEGLVRLALENQLERLGRRELEFLTMPAAERYQEFLRSRAAIAARLSRQDIAAFLGITAASLSRLTAKMHGARRKSLTEPGPRASNSKAPS